MSKQRNLDTRLLAQLVLAAAVWLAAGLILGRNGFAYADGEPFDWAGLLFALISVGITFAVFRRLRAEQKSLRFNYLWYGALWLVPLIMLSSAFERPPADQFTAQELAMPRNYCSAQLLPRVCSSDKPITLVDEFGQQAVVPAGTIFHAGYLAMTTFYGTAGYMGYRAIRNRIKGYRREDLFQ